MDLYTGFLPFENSEEGRYFAYTRGSSEPVISFICHFWRSERDEVSRLASQIVKLKGKQKLFIKSPRNQDKKNGILPLNSTEVKLLNYFFSGITFNL